MSPDNMPLTIEGILKYAPYSTFPEHPRKERSPPFSGIICDRTRKYYTNMSENML